MSVVLRSDITTIRRGQLTRAGHSAVLLNDLLLAAGSDVPESWATTVSSGTASHWTTTSTTSTPTPSTSSGIPGPYSFTFDAKVAGATVASITLPVTIVADCYTVSKTAEIDSSSTGLRSIKNTLSGKRIEIARGVSEAAWGASSGTTAGGIRLVYFGTNGGTVNSSDDAIYTTPLVLTVEDTAFPYTCKRINIQSCADMIIGPGFKLRDKLPLRTSTPTSSTVLVSFATIVAPDGVKVRNARVRFTGNTLLGTTDALEGDWALNGIYLSSSYNCEIDNNVIKGVNQSVTQNLDVFGLHIHHNDSSYIFSDGFGGSNDIQNCLFEYNRTSKMMYTPKNDGVHSDMYQTYTPGSSNGKIQTGNVWRYNVFDQRGSELPTQGIFSPSAGSGGSFPHDQQQAYCNIVLVTKPVGITFGVSTNSFIKNNTVVNLGITHNPPNAPRVRKATFTRGGIYYSDTDTYVNSGGATVPAVPTAAQSGTFHFKGDVSYPTGTWVRAWLRCSNAILAGTGFDLGGNPATSGGFIMFRAKQLVPPNTPPTDARYTGGTVLDGLNVINTAYWDIDLTFSTLPQSSTGTAAMYDSEGLFSAPSTDTSGTIVVSGNAVSQIPNNAQGTSVNNKVVSASDFVDVNHADPLVGFVPKTAAAGGTLDLGGGAWSGALTSTGAFNTPAGITSPSPAAYTMGLLNVGIVGEAITLTFLLDQPAVAAVTITPNATGAAGTFSAATVVIGTGQTTGSCTYTPSAAGSLTLSATNSAGLTNPSAQAVTVGALIATPTTVTPSIVSTVLSGYGPVPVTFTLDKPAVQQVTIAPTTTDTRGFFAPDTLVIPIGSSVAVASYLPRSLGSATISSTNDRGLAALSPLTVTVGRLAATKAAMRRCGIRV